MRNIVTVQAWAIVIEAFVLTLTWVNIISKPRRK